VSAALNQHAMRVRLVLSSVACLALLYVSTLSHKRHDFRKEKYLHTVKCVFRFSQQLLSETFLILLIQRDIITHVHRASGKVPVILVGL